jgi:hypothetical protein
MGKYWGKGTTPLAFPATDLCPRPGDFPIGSALSRAAARMLLKNQRDTRRRIEIVTNVARPWNGPGPAPENPGASYQVDDGRTAAMY